MSDGVHIMGDEIDTAFEDIFLSEERLVKEGYSEGLLAGNQSGYEKGYAIGLKHGADINQELGFYSGFARTWLKMLDHHNCNLSHSCASNVRTVLSTLLEISESFPRHDPHYANLQQQLAKTRAKFKQACSLLKITVNMDNGSAAGISF